MVRPFSSTASLASPATSTSRWAPTRRLPRLLEACAELGFSPLVVDVEPFVRRTFVLPVLDGASAVRVDFIFSTTPYEAQAIERATVRELAGTPVPFASAEDLILHKLFAGRARDEEDALGIVRRQGHALDWSYMEHWSRVFSEVPGREDLPARLEELRGSLGTPG